MIIRFKSFEAEAPAGAVIGIIGDVVRLAPGQGRTLGPLDRLDFTPAKLLVIEHTLAHAGAFERAQAAVELDRMRAAGSIILLFSHEPVLLRELCDEIWWIEQGKMAGRGDPRQILEAYQARVAERFRAWGETRKLPMNPALRRGDGRAEIVSLEIIGENGRPTMTLRSGELASVRVAVRFHAAVENPVIGIMIRTRIGLEVFGTNTELEHMVIGPRSAGETIRVEFAFRCELCPKEYTLTAASHDPDGTAHDWLDDAVAFVVSDSRYTAGVANLHATASWQQL